MMGSQKQIFNGVRVLDLTQWLAGPVATRLMADLGAEVLKVELPPFGEQSRRVRFGKNDGSRIAPSSYFAMQNRGKRGVCIDFKRPEGVAIVKEMASSCDVFFENFAPGVLARYGLDYEALSAVNPKIVMCSISTYGLTSPWRARIGNDLVGLAEGGLLHMMGEPDAAPAYPASAIADHMTALNAFGAISAALFHRERTGEGQFIDLALVDCAYASHDWQLAAWGASDGAIDPQRGGTQRTGTFPYGTFRSRDGFVAISCIDEKQWAALITRMGRADLLEIEEFRTNAGRLQNQAMLTAAIEEWLQSLPSDDEAVRIMADELRMPVGRVLSVGQIARDPILSERTVERIKSPDGRELPMLKSAHKFSKTPPAIPGPAPYLGENTREVLRNLCGYSDEKLDSLIESGVLVETHPG